MPLTVEDVFFLGRLGYRIRLVSVVEPAAEQSLKLQTQLWQVNPSGDRLIIESQQPASEKIDQGDIRDFNLKITGALTEIGNQCQQHPMLRSLFERMLASP